MIAIQSKKELEFDSVSRIKGIITVVIDLFQRNKEGYEIRLIDRCLKKTDKIDEFGKPVFEIHTKTRFKSFTDLEINQINSVLEVDFLEKSKLTKNIDEVIRQGLLLKTQLECQAGEGIFFSDAEDWEIVTDPIS